MSRDLRDEAQDSRMSWIVESGDCVAVASRRHCILRQIVRTNGKEVGVERFHRKRGGWHLDHHAERRAAAGNSGIL